MPTTANPSWSPQWGGGLNSAISSMREPDTEGQKSSSINDSVSILEAKEIVENVLETDIVPFLWGPPGVGKSSIIKQICEEKGWEMIDFRLSTINPVDLMGVPSIDQQAGLARWFRPDFLPTEDTKTKGVLFLDELNLAPLSVQAAAYQLILDKRVGSYCFPKTWKMVSAGNRETDRANVYKISAPLANRFMHVSVQPDLDAWVKWAKDKKINESVISFLLVRPTLLFQMPNDSQKAFPSPRSWVYVSDFVSSFKYVSGTQPSRGFEMAVLGAVGNSVGQEFLKYTSDYNMRAINEILDEFMATGKIKLPKGNKAAELSTRFAITTTITTNYKKGKISRTQFEDFLSNLEPEERASVRKILAETDIKMSENEKYTFLEADLDEKSTSMLVNDETVFISPKGEAEIISPNGQFREVVSYQTNKGVKAISIERSVGIGQAMCFIAGSVVKPL